MACMMFCVLGFALVFAVGCQSQPLSTQGLDGQEAALAAEGSADMRQQDGTAQDPNLATLDGDRMPSDDPFDPDPFLERQRRNLAAGNIEGGPAPGAAAIEPEAENTGSSQQLPDE